MTKIHSRKRNTSLKISEVTIDKQGNIYSPSIAIIGGSIKAGEIKADEISWHGERDLETYAFTSFQDLPAGAKIKGLEVRSNGMVKVIYDEEDGSPGFLLTNADGVADEAQTPLSVAVHREDQMTGRYDF